MPTDFARHLLTWYGLHARILPWRAVSDPYTVWVSEIMLQQTRVETVIPYFQAWMSRFPTVAALAQADEHAVLQTWEGLGYYNRARNLHKAARMVVQQLDGHMPATRSGLEQLPGIGRYTAGAIASMAYGQDEPALDGNVGRVLARVFNLAEPLRSPAGVRTLEALLDENLPSGQAGDFNQAMMDLGADLCTPRNPACEVCPVQTLCEAYRLGIQQERPVANPKKKVPHVMVTAAVIQSGERFLITRRPTGGLLGGMWEFPGGKQEPGESLTECLQREIREELGVAVTVGAEFGVFKHAYTHFKVTLHAFHCTLSDAEPQLLEVNGLKWVLPAELSAFPMGKIDRQISNHLSQTAKI